jgi:hypothetical protein
MSIMVDHRCRIEGMMGIEAGVACDWCGVIEKDEPISLQNLKSRNTYAIYDRDTGKPPISESEWESVIVYIRDNKLNKFMIRDQTPMYRMLERATR